MVLGCLSLVRLRLVLIILSLFLIVESSLIDHRGDHGGLPYKTSAQIIANRKCKFYGAKLALQSPSPMRVQELEHINMPQDFYTNQETD